MIHKLANVVLHQVYGGLNRLNFCAGDTVTIGVRSFPVTRSMTGREWARSQKLNFTKINPWDVELNAI